MPKAAWGVEMSKLIYGLYGIVVGVLALAASLSTIYANLKSQAEKNITLEIAIALAAPGSDISTVASAKSVPEAIDALKYVIQPVKKPELPPSDPMPAIKSVSGPEVVLKMNEVAKITEAQIPVVLTSLKSTRANVKIYGKEIQLELTNSAKLPKPVDNCFLTFLAATLPAGESYSEIKGSAKFGIDCEQP